MKLLTPAKPVTPYQHTFTRKKVVDFLDRYTTMTVPTMINRFKLDPATALRRRTGDRFPRNIEEHLTFRQLAIQEYGTESPVAHYLRALGIIVRLKDENLVYLTNDRSTVMPRKN